MVLAMPDLSNLPEDPTTPRAPRSISKDNSSDGGSSSQAASSPLSTRSSLVEDPDNDDTLGPATADLFPSPLPEDRQALHALLDTVRGHYDTMRSELSHVRKTHAVLLKRSSDWQADLEAHRRRVPELEEALRKEVSEREEEQTKVKDLRMRAEESRRAIMRLQGEQSDARTKAKVENRRSMGPGAMAGWGASAASPPPREGLDDAEIKELKKSKRASLAFGPNAGAAIAAAGRGHRRTASGSRLESGDESEQPTANYASGAQTIGRSGSVGGLRGLRLSGVPGSISSSYLSTLRDAETNGASGSARSSVVSNPSRMSATVSPRSNLAELDESDPIAQAEAALTRRAPPSRSSESQMSLSLPVPQRSNSGSGVSSIGSIGSIGSPILEDADEPGESAAGSTAAGSSSSNNYAAMRATAELRAKDAEVQRLRLRLEDMRIQLDEAVEGRTASEVCLKALRDFIATHDEAADKVVAGEEGGEKGASVGATMLRGVKLPPLPTDAEDVGGAGSSPASKASTSAAGSNSTWTMRLPQMMRLNTSESTSASASSGTDTIGRRTSSTSPVAPIGSTLSSLWSRSSGSSAKEDEQPSTNGSSTAALSTSPEPSTASTGSNIRSWFNRRASEVPSSWSLASAGAASDSKRSSNGSAGGGGAPSPTLSKTLSPPARSPTHSMPSPPFASLDHSALTPTTPQAPQPAAQTPPTMDAPPQVGTQRRAMRNRERLGGLGEDDLFAPPAFD